MRFDLLHGGVVDQRPEQNAALQPIADLELRNGRTQFPGKLVIHVVMNIEPVCTDASLPAVPILRRNSAFNRGIDIGIVENDERRIAAQFQRHFLDRRRALRHQQTADLRRPREGQLPDDRITRQLRANRLRVAGHDIQHALGQPRTLSQHGHRER